MDRKTLGEQLREIRKTNGLSQLEVANRLDMTHQEISRIERGLHNMGIESLSKVASELGYEIKLVKKEP